MHLRCKKTFSFFPRLRRSHGEYSPFQNSLIRTCKGYSLFKDSHCMLGCLPDNVQRFLEHSLDQGKNKIIYNRRILEKGSELFQLRTTRICLFIFFLIDFFLNGILVAPKWRQVSLPLALGPSVAKEKPACLFRDPPPPPPASRIPGSTPGHI